MTEPTDDITELEELLARANPVRESDLPDATESLSAQALYHYITGDTLNPSVDRLPPKCRRIWRGRRVLVPISATILALAGFGVGGAYAGFFTNQTTDRLDVLCYSTPSLQGTQLAVAATAQGPVVTCAQAWAKGQIGSGPVPLLVACVNDQGVAAVFPSAPGASVCAELGLPPLPAGATSVAATTTTVVPSAATPHGSMPPQLRDAIVTQLQQQCLSGAAAKLSLMRLFANDDIDWTVTVESFPPGRPCASPGFDESTRTVVLSGIPPLPDTSNTG